MSNTTRREEMVRHLETMDGRTGDIKDELYRHFMSKSKDESGDVVNRSYSMQSGYSDIIKGIQGDRHQYVTLALFNSPSRRRKSTIRATSGLYVDLDDSLFNGDGRIGLDLIDDSIRAARLPEPSLVIFTGGGFHVYWLFNSLYYFNNDEDIRRYEEVIGDIIESLSIIGADPKSRDATRLLRLAGTINHKYNSSPAVSIVESNDLRYDIGDFDGLRVVKKLPKLYMQSNKKEVIKQSLAIEEPKASKQSRVINQSLTRPEEDFPFHLLGDIIIDAQRELERRNPHARYMADRNQEVIVDLIVNYTNLPRNRFVFDDGVVGQYIVKGNRNHFLWALSRRGVTYEHLDIINRTMLLPSLSHNEFMNAVNVWRTMGGIPKINSMVRDLGLTLSEQSRMMTLRIDYEKLLDEQERLVRTRIDQLISESNHQIVLASKGKNSKVLAGDLDLTVRQVNHLKKQERREPTMTSEEREQEIRDMYRNTERTGRVALEELYADYQLVGEVLDRIIKNHALIYNLRVPLTEQQRDDIQTMAESIITKVEFITSQIQAYEEFVADSSECYFKSGKVKKSVLLDKLNVLKASTGRLVTV